ncbi:hypothetical protein KL942_005304 [Ogataea angusta]|uniref:Major facilitator superfamily (MFS) profile domain-containing protein n=1 Tax=Pichia angusta TaxID=870730 RepID=A0ABQ7RPN1_PICAN|nr:hypothetical protein KL942_005304 [Ogataea angusta]KAG7845531.1 hypothetical protein KL940_005217 [Ogataea angusta]KAG7854854.1 hypothetical protein KL939_004603 [Ogataea angusta]
MSKENTSVTVEEVAAVGHGDPVLARKLRLINDAIDEIGFTWYHFQLFCIAGYGYAVDSQLELIQSSVHSYVALQFGADYPTDTQTTYVGYVLGALFWGFGGDLIGRKLAFNTSLILAALLGFATGGMNSFATYCIFNALANFCAGGNLVMDVTVFMEYVPFKWQFLNTMMAMWWGIGQTVNNLVCWGFLPNYSSGWRYVWYTNSGIILFCGLLRLFVLRLDETPKFLVSTGRDDEAVQALQRIARKYKRPCSLTLDQLQACGELCSDYYSPQQGWQPAKMLAAVKEHVRILYQNKVVAYSTTSLMLSYLLVGFSSSIFYNFLYIYIQSHGGNTAAPSHIVYRNSTLSYMTAIFGPIFSAVLVRAFGRRYTMLFGGVATMAIMFGYTTVRTPAGDAGFSSATNFFMNVYYGCLYAYATEIFPAQARGTGMGLASVLGAIGGALSPVAYHFGESSGTSVPIWLAGALFGVLGILAAFYPFEPSGKGLNLVRLGNRSEVI